VRRKIDYAAYGLQYAAWWLRTPAWQRRIVQKVRGSFPGRHPKRLAQRAGFGQSQPL
jgi:hypothetical protein